MGGGGCYCRLVILQMRWFKVTYREEQGVWFKWEMRSKQNKKGFADDKTHDAISMDDNTYTQSTNGMGETREHNKN